MDLFQACCRDANATLPRRGTPDSAGFDFAASADCEIPAWSRCTVPTGVIVAIAPGYVGQLWSRSSMAIKGCDVQAGVIDSDYRGPVGVVLSNGTDAPIRIKCGERVAQMIILPIYAGPVKEVSSVGELPATQRGQGGFGSTGK